MPNSSPNVTPQPSSIDRPGAEFQAIARSVELLNYAKIFPWSCLAVALVTGVPTVLFDPDSTLYSMNIVWTNRLTAVLATVFGVLGVWRLRTGQHQISQQPELWLGGTLLLCMAINNALLLIDTGESRHAWAAILTMICAACLYPRWLGILAVTIPQVGVVLWMANDNAWTASWLFGFFATFGGALVALLGYYARRISTQRHQALLAERASMIEALKEDALERAMLQERALNERHLSTLGRLAGGIAHDLNNILVPILGNAAMLEESVETSDHQRQAKEVMIAAGRARNLSQQLGYFSTRGNTEPETLELNRTLSELAPIVWRALPQGVDIKIQDNPQSTYLTLNRMALQDLITNLLLDAGNATRAGGAVSLRVFPAANLPPEFTAMPGRDYCAIAITDDAETLSTDEQKRLLDSRNLGTGERGLGLRSARASAELLGGGLTIESADSGGNQFCLFLPLRTEKNTTNKVPDARISSAVATEVLVVDDEPAVRNVTVQLLQRAGFLVRSCDSGEAALNEISGHLPDAVVMDLRMPGMGGRAAVENIREHNPHLPIVICTGFAGDAQGWLDKLPNCALLLKPYETQELISTVKRLLRHELAAD